MTPYPKKKIANEARKLARRCVEGTAPELSVGRLAQSTLSGGIGWCALGTVLHAAAPMNEFDCFEMLPPAGRLLVIEANDEARDHADRQSRLVFPLLALADAVEAA